MTALGDRLRRGLARTRALLETPVEDIVRGRRPLAPADLEAIEEALLAADLGLPAVNDAVAVLRERSGDLQGEGLEGMREVLRDHLQAVLATPSLPSSTEHRPRVVLLVGVNGVGKTTTAGKLACQWRARGESVLLVAADTFRAAAAEQLEIWAQRTGSAFHRGAAGADPSAVLTDGLRLASARGIDVVAVDTAGRLHTKSNLMAELAKMLRVCAREVAEAPHESLLVLDATVGSNGLAQAREFARAAGVTGLVLTKLDGTARGGIAVAVVRELGLPIRYVGVGETVDDLLPFDAAAFAAGLVGS